MKLLILDEAGIVLNVVADTVLDQDTAEKTMKIGSCKVLVVGDDDANVIGKKYSTKTMVQKLFGGLLQ